ncbi:hypothetical protein ACHAXT_010499 [Thalassiosira profunda]
MSDAPDPSPGGAKRKRGRDKNKRQRQRHEASAIYRGIEFRPRPSSGRPGSPHRYFEDSYDVVDCDAGGCLPSPAMELDGIQSKSASIDTQQPKMEDEDANEPMQQSSGSTQVVHRHLNGLCIVTAGNALTECATKAGETEGGSNITIASVRYLVKASKDSQSARGKMRTKMKKQKRADRDEGAEGSREEHNGSVSPRDPLCEISLSDGTTLQLNCCVAGTVIELNHRLEKAAKGAEENGEGASNGAVVGVRDPSLLLKDPLLDGYLAVIMPARGPFPPTIDGGC